MRDFENKNHWALVLGGSSGLGLASAKKLAAHGMNIIAVYRSSRTQKEEIEKDFQEIKDMGVELMQYNLDAVNGEKRQEMIQDMEASLSTGAKIKALVHSIAKGNLKSMNSVAGPSLKSDDFELTIKAMGISLYNWTRALVDQNLFDADARVISFTSEGSSKAWENYAAVSAAKATLESITRSIALEYASFGIKANCIQAGVTDTASLQMIPGSEDIIKHSLKRNPNKRLTTPADVANVVYLLCKDEASWITGTVIQVDGGEHLR